MTDDYLHFQRDVLAEVGRKTQVWLVMPTRGGPPLGEIRWFGRWRQYAYFPEGDTVLSSGCLDVITAEVRRLMAERRPR